MTGNSPDMAPQGETEGANFRIERQEGGDDGEGVNTQGKSDQENGKDLPVKGAMY